MQNLFFSVWIFLKGRIYLVYTRIIRAKTVNPLWYIVNIAETTSEWLQEIGKVNINSISWKHFGWIYSVVMVGWRSAVTVANRLFTNSAAFWTGLFRLRALSKSSMLTVVFWNIAFQCSCACLQMCLRVPSSYLLPCHILLCLDELWQPSSVQRRKREHRVLSGDMRPASQSVFRGEGWLAWTHN